jgi:transcription termination factor NusB
MRKRTKARELVLQLLYQADVSGVSVTIWRMIFCHECRRRGPFRQDICRILSRISVPT